MEFELELIGHEVKAAIMLHVVATTGRVMGYCGGRLRLTREWISLWVHVRSAIWISVIKWNHLCIVVLSLKVLWNLLLLSLSDIYIRIDTIIHIYRCRNVRLTINHLLGSIGNNFSISSSLLHRLSISAGTFGHFIFLRLLGWIIWILLLSRLIHHICLGSSCGHHILLLLDESLHIHRICSLLGIRHLRRHSQHWVHHWHHTIYTIVKHEHVLLSCSCWHLSGIRNLSVVLFLQISKLLSLSSQDLLRLELEVHVLFHLGLLIEIRR